MPFLFNDAPARALLARNSLHQVVIRFDFPIVLGIATTDEAGELITARQSKLLEEVQRQFGSRLPMYSPVQAQRFSLDFTDPAKPKLRPTTEGPAHIFASMTNDRQCELTATSFSYIANGSYETFERFVEEFWETWTIVQSIMGVRAVTRVGVRKINRFSIAAGGGIWESLRPKIKDEFLPPVHIDPRALLEYSARQTFRVEDRSLICICQSAFRAVEENQHAFFIDLDVVDLGATNPDNVRNKIRDMNLVLWELFWYSLKPDFFESLRRR